MQNNTSIKAAFTSDVRKIQYSGWGLISGVGGTCGNGGNSICERGCDIPGVHCNNMEPGGGDDSGCFSTYLASFCPYLSVAQHLIPPLLYFLHSHYYLLAPNLVCLYCLPVVLRLICNADVFCLSAMASWPSFSLSKASCKNIFNLLSVAIEASFLIFVVTSKQSSTFLLIMYCPLSLVFFLLKFYRVVTLNSFKGPLCCIFCAKMTSSSNFFS